VAERASFTFFEPVAPGRTAVWAGGLGWDAHEPSHVGVIALIDGVEVAVDTTRPDRRRGVDERLRLIALDLICDHVLQRHPAAGLPWSIVVVPDERTIPVGGEDMVFSGARVDGSERWSGEATVDDLVLRVTTTGPATFAVDRCRDWRSVPEHPPPDGQGV
jgi:hypothetical protein